MKKKILIIGGIVILLAASQWLAVKLIYAHKLNGSPATLISKIYNLEAGYIEDVVNNEKIGIKLVDYFNNKKFVVNFLEKDETLGFTDEEVDSIIWERLVKDAWLNRVANTNSLTVSDEELEEYLQAIPDLEELIRATEEDFKIPFAKYKNMVIKPIILETKVYSLLLSNFADAEGVNKIQTAYEELESGRNFIAVAKEYSDDLTYVDNTIWVSNADNPEIYDPIKDIDVGEYSKIVQIPGAYVIWYVDSVTDDGAKELRGLLVTAKPLEAFLEDFKSKVNIKRTY